MSGGRNIGLHSKQEKHPRRESLPLAVPCATAVLLLSGAILAIACSLPAAVTGDTPAADTLYIYIYICCICCLRDCKDSDS